MYYCWILNSTGPLTFICQEYCLTGDLQVTSSRLLCLFLIDTVCKPCQDGWLWFQSKCYLFTEYKYYSEWKSWEESQNACRGLAADLVVIESQDEQVRRDFNSISFVFFLLEWSPAAVCAENFIKWLSEILIVDFILWIYLFYYYYDNGTILINQLKDKMLRLNL